MFTDRDLDTLTRTVYGECRNEPYEGIVAVAWVIRNRAEDKDKRFGDDIVDVCLKPQQFSCWNTSIPGRNSMMRASNSPVYHKVLGICALVLSSQITDPTSGANHYYAEYLDAQGKKPSWADDTRLVKKIGVHKFYRL